MAQGQWRKLANWKVCIYGKCNYGVSMKLSRIFAVTAILAILSACANVPKVQSELKIMAFNIRCGNCEKATDPNHWSKRKILIEKILQTEKPDIIATQEAEEFQAQDIAKITGFSFYGIGREEGEIGERNAILWNPARFEALKTQTIWLNPTYKKFEKGWDASWRRTLCMIEFQDKVTKRIFWVFDAHLDNDGKIARFESAKIILSQIKQRAPQPVILLGDLNDVMGSQTYLTLSEKLKPISHYAPDDFTFNGFGKDMRAGFIIDHIFANFDAKPHDFKIIKDKFDGLYPSDHFPIIATIRIP